MRRQIVALLPRLRRLAWVIARNDQDSDDLLQMTIERALARSDSWVPGTRLDLWIFRIMKNLWIDEIRTRNRWGRLVESLPDSDEIDDRGAAADALLDAMELARIKARVDALPDEQRMAVKLVLLGHYSYTEAASILEIPEGTLTSRLARGRAALLRHYQGGGTR
ncbi:RNA polymerase sigma factor [Novosphingobium sp. G106]|uniref:RNA polymerase sigma factor n=1 Tax=Novosphingobium sp. G106 TaxID=2849500 RepID=UPI002811F643|nr:RNA polymerase sigma factor [Novosphingobium sp. G106]